MNWSDTIEARKVRCGRTMRPVHKPIREYHRWATSFGYAQHLCALAVFVIGLVKILSVVLGFIRG